MAGQIKRILDRIIQDRSQGNETIAMTTKIKLVLKGVDPDKYSVLSEDDSATLLKVKEIARELGVAL